jgi:hypothetical protein
MKFLSMGMDSLGVRDAGCGNALVWSRPELDARVLLQQPGQHWKAFDKQADNEFPRWCAGQKTG